MLLGKQFLKEISGVISILGEDFLYFRGFNGELKEILRKLSFKSYLILRAQYENEFTLPKLSLSTSGDSSICSEMDQFIIIKFQFYITRYDRCSNLNDIIIEPLYYAIGMIMKDMKCSFYPNLEIEAVVRLVKSKRKIKVVDNKINLLLSRVQKHSIEAKFKLDDLSKNVYMSRRKVQYIFSENGLNFRDVLSKSRLSNVFNLVIHEPNILLSELALKAGFANLDSANKATNRFKGFDLKSYKDSIVKLSHDE